MRKALMWLADKGAEEHLAVSLGSLRLRAPDTWTISIKIVIDCGLTQVMRDFLRSAESELLYVVPVSAVTSDTSGAAPGLVAMRTRIHAAFFSKELQHAGILPRFEVCCVCDADTVFLRSLAIPTPGTNSDVVVMKEWDSKNGIEHPMLLFRKSTFSVPITEIDTDFVAEAIGVSSADFRLIPTYNTGVYVFGAKSDYCEQWRKEYDTLLSVTDRSGRHIFSPYSAEQNAFSLAVYRRAITGDPLPRSLNQFPPRPPGEWPPPTAIAHFITFSRNSHEPRYRLWFEMRDSVQNDGWIPASVLRTPPRLI